MVRKAAEAAAAEGAGEEGEAAAEGTAAAAGGEAADVDVLQQRADHRLGRSRRAAASLHAGNPTITFHKFGGGTIYINEPYPAVINWPAEEFASLLDGMATAKLPDGDDNRLAMMISVRDNAKERHTMVVELLRAKTLVVGAPPRPPSPPIRPIPRANPSPRPPLPAPGTDGDDDPVSNLQLTIRPMKEGRRPGPPGDQQHSRRLRRVPGDDRHSGHCGAPERRGDRTVQRHRQGRL